jgi:hypothetical protein
MGECDIVSAILQGHRIVKSMSREHGSHEPPGASGAHLTRRTRIAGPLREECDLYRMCSLSRCDTSRAHTWAALSLSLSDRMCYFSLCDKYGAVWYVTSLHFTWAAVSACHCSWLCGKCSVVVLSLAWLGSCCRQDTFHTTQYRAGPRVTLWR